MAINPYRRYCIIVGCRNVPAEGYERCPTHIDHSPVPWPVGTVLITDAECQVCRSTMTHEVRIVGPNELEVICEEQCHCRDQTDATRLVYDLARAMIKT